MIILWTNLHHIEQLQLISNIDKSMNNLKNNRLHPIKSLMNSQQNSRQNSIQKQHMPESLNKSIKLNNFPNPYLKKFNLRKINRTQQSLKKKSISNDETKQDQTHPRETQQRKNQSLDQRKDKKNNSIRFHTEKLRNKTNEALKQSPYKAGGHMLTIDHQQIINESKYQHLTNFQRQQIYRHQVYYVGKRRISSIRDFTDKNNDARVAAHDSILYRYEVLDILGKGSFGQVFKAFDHKKKQLCAIKIIRNQPKFCTQAKVQIKLLEHVLIKDPKLKSNIIRMKQAFFFRGHPCLVFELLHQNLYEFLRQFKFAGLGLDLILRFTIQILQGLLFFQKYNVIHCDLKPQNILLKQKNKTGIKIIDLGSGCYQQDQIYTYIQSRFYRAPEIIFGIPYTNAIDMWSLGCIVMELYHGYPIFPGQDQHEQVAMFMQVLGVPPKELIEKGCRTKKFFIDFKPKIKPNKKGVLRKPNSITIQGLLNTTNKDLVDFLNRIFVWQPQKRLTPSQALLHPWIVESLPQQIRKQHISQVQKNLQF